MSGCIGFQETEHRCPFPATTPAGIWCPECERARIAYLSCQFVKITEAFECAPSSAPSDHETIDDAGRTP